VRQQNLPGGVAPGTVIPAGQPLPATLVVTSSDVLSTGGVQVEGSGLPVNLLAYRIGENESPRPQDRFYAFYNYYSNVDGSRLPPFIAKTDLHRYVFGFEKTFLDGDASIGLRMPYLSIQGDRLFDRDTFGDLSVILKYAFINDPFQRDACGNLNGGDVLSGGLVVTAPTGGTNARASFVADIHPTIIQPWLGGIYNMDRCYVQGFSSLAVPTDDRAPTVLFNSMQIGYFVHRDMTGEALCRSVVPLFEAHVTTPLSKRGTDRIPVGGRDIVSCTGAVAIGLGSCSTVNIGTSVPVTGPKPYDIEGMVQFNFFY
jgi:hypothetical protein